MIFSVGYDETTESIMRALKNDCHVGRIMDKSLASSECKASFPLDFSRHAQARMRQRGLTRTDVELISKVGELVTDGYVMTNHAVDQRIHELRREISRIENLRGVALIEGGNKVITVFRADHRRICRLREKQ